MPSFGLFGTGTGLYTPLATFFFLTKTTGRPIQLRYQLVRFVLAPPSNSFISNWSLVPFGMQVSKIEEVIHSNLK